MADASSTCAVLLTLDPLDVARIEADVRDDSAGAIVTFIGTTRNEHLGRRVLYLEYEAQQSMALKMMYALCLESMQRFGLAKVRLHHRLGRLEIGDASVAIAVSSAHRGAAFDGCRFLIDTLKTTIPIWKKEHYADSSAPQWVGPDGKPVVP